MKTKVLSALILVISCIFQACHSPETRSASAKDSARQDSIKRKNNAKTESKDNTFQSKADDDTAGFIKEAGTGGMMEVELGKVAIQKTKNEKIKAFAEQMVADHTKANQQLKTIAEKLKILVPTEYPADQKKHMEMMKNLSDSEFDNHYIDMMINDHQKTIDLFKRGANSTVKELSDYAKNTLPIIIQHYNSAMKIQSEMK